ncbi:MAG: dihydrolipoyl dehydrogenase [Polyangia bacterium]|jgi:dihydrolipoamide dehydrogenase|nr:dihydrolipoyl dehydrogenase [Polyangia bacterium]
MVMGTLEMETQVLVIGGGPGGYVAAIRAADLGKEVVLIEERPSLGGVCLLEGCIPSKTLIHAVDLLESARDASKLGITFEGARVDLGRLRSFKSEVVKGLSTGVKGLLDRRGVEVVKGRARFRAPGLVSVEGGPDLRYTDVIIATGSRPRRLGAAGELELWSSREALDLPELPRSLVVVGGGYIGLELGLVYAGLGSEVTLLESSEELLAGADMDLVGPVLGHAKASFAKILTGAKVVGVRKLSGGFGLTIERQGREELLEASQVLVAIGRIPNTDDLGLESLGLAPDKGGFLVTDEACRTAIPHVYAIGDVTHGPMLAHKASREAKVAAEVIAEHKSAFDNRAIPAVVFTSPEIAWAGLTEREAAAIGRQVKVGSFPLRALGRARTLGRTEGLVKIISDPETSRVLGVGMVGPQASDLIAEGVLAIEMGATLEDLMVTIHPHPTLSEAIMEAAEVAAGMPVHLPPGRPPARAKEEVR